MTRNWTLPLLLGLATAVLLALALWPQEVPMADVVVSGRDLGAGAVLAAQDLTVITVPAAQAPADAVANPDLLVGQSLATVRYAGEPITPRHLGPAVVLAPDERGIAVQVRADTGLAGLLRPGMAVGVVATLEDNDRQVYAKSVVEGLRVLYVPPDFQAQPYRPATYQATVDNGTNTTSSPPPSAVQPVREGVVVLAASTLPAPVVQEAAEIILARQLAASAASTGTDETADGQSGAEEPTGQVDEEPPQVTWAVPVELLAALNAAGAAFTLVLVPAQSQPYTTPGLDLAVLLPTPVDESLAGFPGGRP